MTITPERQARRREGFPGQRMRVLPRPLVATALASPVLSQLLVTDVGYFPRASSHGRARAHGAAQHVVIVCAAGRGTCTLPSGVHQVGAGQAVALPAGLPHRYEADAAEPWTIWWMHLVGHQVPALLEAVGATADQPVVGVGDPARVVSLIDTVIRRMERDETMATLLASSGAAWHALALLAADRRTISREQADPIEATIEHLRANVSTRISLVDLAGMAGLSVSHYSALFRRATGYGALEYQTRLRMGAARELLDTTDGPVAGVAARVGYADALYFSRQFRRIHGISPTEYRSHDKG
ncbi:helix-turn-helix transcriptional regulator [Cellulomonas fengjieae]|uniref:AraC family transcriptional regulator n=1 Tax=Cellulomonas fengjieae TaxID=2819978 RepID=A0ABS3SHK1_9CELL|nr:AraC family transcriptional regulator [Cellulomonas fengjieae]MBO3085231.1 AraC family transcriptional regulator [Cellulomonas fengjieae]MBO3100978.1 AraC family transcriptional regulator [Cellulomonas fengjieae]QVI66203.1 AraC family transcriptional regulator [Cellulomonas fengjieae]